MTDNRGGKTRTPPPGLRDRGTHGKHRPCGFRLLQGGHHRYRRRQDDESAGSRKQPARKQAGSPTRKTGVLTAHREAF